MGEAKRRRNRQQQIIDAHPWCIYCGAVATTTDHCPPRAAFRNRNWPEGYEFPACVPCNSSARIDELVLAALFLSESAGDNESSMQEWKLLLRGVLNNAPEIADEWQTPSRNEVRKILRQAYGKDGDERRRRRYSAIVVGPRTNEIVVRFMIKLSKALYFRHNRHVFDGVLYTYQIDKMRADTTPEYLKEVYRMATGLPALSRNNKSLYDQFIYRFNHSAADKVAYAVVEFGVQWVFQLMAIPREMDEQLISREEAAAGMLNFRHECFLEAAKRNQDLNSRLDRREIS